MDDVIFDQAALPTYKLAQEAAKDVRVVLCGEGGDELLAGYRRYQKAAWPLWLGGGLRPRKGIFEKAGLSSESLASWDGALDWRVLEEKKKWGNSLQALQSLDLEGWLANSLLIKLDRMLMAHSLEGRTPFLDPEVAGASFGLAASLKIKSGKGKWLLRHLLDKRLPVSQPFAKKKGFRVPVQDWMKKKGERLGGLVAAQPGVEALFNERQVRHLFVTINKDNEFAAWTLLMYALWHQVHIRGRTPVGDTLTMLVG